AAAVVFINEGFAHPPWSALTVPASKESWIGRTVERGRYRITSRLGAGGMGTVYLAEHAKLRCPVVVKVPHRGLLERPEAVVRFRREVRTLIKLSHPHIVRITDFGEHKCLPFVVMQYFPGGDLRGRMREDDAGNLLPMPPAGLWAWLPDV